jgi:hypothetical protein
MARRIRFQKLVSWSVQGPIVSRLLLHFLAYNAATLFLLSTVWAAHSTLASLSDTPAVAAPLTFWRQAAPVIICMTLMTPFMIWDLMALTNRIAGPLWRFEQLMGDFVRSGTLRRAKLRNGDLLTDFQKQFNEFAEALHALYPETRPTTGTSAVIAAQSEPSLPTDRGQREDCRQPQLENATR